jgi:hypothetical protein
MVDRPGEYLNGTDFEPAWSVACVSGGDPGVAAECWLRRVTARHFEPRAPRGTPRSACTAESAAPVAFMTDAAHRWSRSRHPCPPKVTHSIGWVTVRPNPTIVHLRGADAHCF